jgi:cell fate (sporulation/competence/biofilm development) regulator YlbF (YheA/YmcA/DUF963 family)
MDQKHNQEVTAIINKAKELSQLITEHPITKEYQTLHDKVQNDRIAQEILSRLIALGRELSEQGQQGKPVQTEQNAENKLLQIELEKNSLVKEFLQSQKTYLQFIQQIQAKIQHPES